MEDSLFHEEERKEVIKDFAETVNDIIDLKSKRSEHFWKSLKDHMDKDK